MVGSVMGSCAIPSRPLGLIASRTRPPFRRPRTVANGTYGCRHSLER